MGIEFVGALQMKFLHKFLPYFQDIFILSETGAD